MGLWRAAVLLLCALASPLAARADDDDGAVLVLTSSNFDKTIKAEKVIAVEFYAPWCGHCKSLAPAWKEAASVLKPEGIALAKVDATVEESLAKRFKVDGYPTIKVFRDGVESAYSGPRDANGIVSYMRAKAAPSVRPMTDADIKKQLKELVEGAPEPLVVLFVAKDSDFTASRPGKLIEAYKAAAEALRESLVFAVTSDAEARTAAGVKPGTVAVLHSSLAPGKLQPPAVPFTGSPDKLFDWVQKAVLPVVGELTSRTAPRYRSSGKPVVRVAINTDWVGDAKGANYWLNRLRKLAVAHPKLAFATVKPDSPQAALDDFGVSPRQRDFSVTATVDEAKYACESVWSPTAPVPVEEWLTKLADGSLEAYVKSEPIPEEPKDNGVTVVVGKTFEAVGTQDDKDILLEFYAPWCGHCKALAPKLELLAQSLEHVETLRIAKFDATANDWMDKGVYAVKGYPTLFFKPAGKSPIPYEGERDPLPLAEYMAAHATHKFVVPASLRTGGGKVKKPKKGKTAPVAGDKAEL